jgi:hypothetical protein
MKIGQPKLSERNSQNSELFVTPINVAPNVILEGEDYGLKARINVSARKRVICPSCLSRVRLFNNFL